MKTESPQTFESIWKRPSENPPKDREEETVVIILNTTKGYLPTLTTRYAYYYQDLEFWNKRIKTWCYLSEFVNFLPDFAKEEK